MDHFEFTTLAHADHRLCSPLSNEKLDRIVAATRLPAASARALELCTGKGELLFRVLEQNPHATGVGVDVNRAFLAEARVEAERRGLEPRVELVEHDAWAFAAFSSGWDLVANVGGVRKDDSIASTLRAMAQLVRPGGLVLFGEGYWRVPPNPEDVEAFGASVDEMGSHEENIRSGREAGLTLLYACAASQDDFDHYEGLYWSAMERYLRAHPDHRAARAMRERIHMFRDSYFEWRRDTMGFGVYLFCR